MIIFAYVVSVSFEVRESRNYTRRDYTPQLKHKLAPKHSGSCSFKMTSSCKCPPNMHCGPYASHFQGEQSAIETSTHQQIHQDDWHGQEEDEEEDERGFLVRHHGSERFSVLRFQVVDQHGAVIQFTNHHHCHFDDSFREGFKSVLLEKNVPRNIYFILLL